MKKLVVLSVLSMLAAAQLRAEENCGVIPGPTYELPGTCIDKKTVTCPPCPICPKTRCDVVQGSCQYVPARAVQEQYCEKKVCHVCHKHCGGACTRKSHGHVVEETVVEKRAPRAQNAAHNVRSKAVRRANGN